MAKNVKDFAYAFHIESLRVKFGEKFEFRDRVTGSTRIRVNISQQ